MVPTQQKKPERSPGCAPECAPECAPGSLAVVSGGRGATSPEGGGSCDEHISYRYVWTRRPLSITGCGGSSGLPAKSSPPGLTWKQVLNWRVECQHLKERAAAGSLLPVVARICGLHAQLMSSAELAVWARVDHLPREEIQRALWEERSLVKTWAMRGTLHLLPAAEYPLWQAALGTYDHFLKGAWLRAYGVSQSELENLIDVIGEVLDGQMLTREELAKRVGEKVGSKGLPERLAGSWGSMLKPAAFRGKLCFAPSSGRNVRFTRPDGWLAPGRPIEPQDGMREVTRRYLDAYGPATREDLARWWGGFTPAKARKAFEALGDQATLVDVEGTESWMLTEYLEDVTGADPQKSVRLLPAFDPYVIGAPRAQPKVLTAEEKPRVFRPQGWISPVVLVNGKIVGVWKHEKKGDRVRVHVAPFGAIPAWARREIVREADRLATFLGGEPLLDFED